MDVMLELGVPLCQRVSMRGGLLEDGTEIGTYGISEGVAGSDGGGGRLMKVGADMVM